MKRLLVLVFLFSFASTVVKAQDIPRPDWNTMLNQPPLEGSFSIDSSSTQSNGNIFSKMYHWAGHHKRFLAMEGAAVTGAVIHYVGLKECREISVEFCDSHYGAAWAMYWFTTGVTVVAMPAIAEGCWKDQQGKFCYVFAYSGSVGQAAWGLHEYRIEPHAFDK